MSECICGYPDVFLVKPLGVSNEYAPGCPQHDPDFQVKPAEPRPFVVGDEVRVTKRRDNWFDLNGGYSSWSGDEEALFGKTFPISDMDSGGDILEGNAILSPKSLTLITPAPDKAEAIGSPVTFPDKAEAGREGDREVPAQDERGSNLPAEAVCSTQYCGGPEHPVSWYPTHGWLEGSREMNGGTTYESRSTVPQPDVSRLPSALLITNVARPAPAPLYKKHAGPQPKWRSTL